jgi:hypothetical protein
MPEQVVGRGRQRPGDGDPGIGLRHARVQARPQEVTCRLASAVIWRLSRW